MGKSKTIAIRLSNELIKIAEQRMKDSGEESVGRYCKKIITAELNQVNKAENSSPTNLSANDLLPMIKLIENSRELMLRSFQFLFATADAQNNFEEHIQEVEDEWKNLTRKRASKHSQNNFDADDFFNAMSERLRETFDDKNLEMNSEEELGVFGQEGVVVQTEDTLLPA